MTPASRMAAASTRPNTPEEDLLLLKRVAAQDREAFRQLFLAYHPRVVRFLFRLTRSAEVAEEVFNDVMFVVWQKASEFKGRSKVSTWVLGIAYRKGLKAAKKAYRERAQQPLSELDLATLRTPGSMADRREQRDSIAKALEMLPQAQRAVIELAYFLGYSCREIAAIVDCPVNTVKTRMFHARKRLRTILPHLDAPGRPEPEEKSP